MTTQCRTSYWGLVVLLLVLGCEHQIHVRPMTQYSAIPAPQFELEYDKRRDAGKVESIQIYDVTNKRPTLNWKATSVTRRRAKKIYRFTYGVAPLGMATRGKTVPLKQSHVYEVCVEGRRVECHRFGVGSNGVLQAAERPPDAYKLLREWTP